MLWFRSLALDTTLHKFTMLNRWGTVLKAKLKNKKSWRLHHIRKPRQRNKKLSEIEQLLSVQKHVFLPTHFNNRFSAGRKLFHKNHNTAPKELGEKVITIIDPPLTGPLPAAIIVEFCLLSKKKTDRHKLSSLFYILFMSTKSRKYFTKSKYCLSEHWLQT